MGQRQKTAGPVPSRTGRDRDSWQKAFEVDITDVVHLDAPNVVVVRVEDRTGAGGIWRGVRLITLTP